MQRTCENCGVWSPSNCRFCCRSQFGGLADMHKFRESTMQTQIDELQAKLDSLIADMTSIAELPHWVSEIAANALKKIETKPCQ